MKLQRSVDTTATPAQVFALSSIPLALGRGVDTLMDKTVAPGFTKIGPAVRKRLPGWPEDPPAGAMAGRTAAVTGATSGLGLATAEGLARLGARLRLVVRDVPKGERVLAELRERVPGLDATIDRCDVADLDDVRRFAAELDLDRLDVLVHNAGAMPAERTESQQGHELTMAIHVLGPVLMTELLRERLTGHDARVGARDLGRNVRPAAAARRPGVPLGRVLTHDGVRAQQAGPGRAAADPGRPVGATGDRRARHPPGLGSHPRRHGVAAHLQQGDGPVAA